MPVGRRRLAARQFGATRFKIARFKVALSPDAWGGFRIPAGSVRGCRFEAPNSGYTVAIHPRSAAAETAGRPCRATVGSEELPTVARVAGASTAIPAIGLRLVFEALPLGKSPP